MATFRVFVERPVYERGYYVVQAESAEEAYKKAERLFEASDPSNMEYFSGSADSELLELDFVEEIEPGTPEWIEEDGENEEEV